MTTTFATIARISIAAAALAIALGTTQVHAKGFDIDLSVHGDPRFEYLFDTGVCWETQIAAPGPVAGWQNAGVTHGLQFYNSKGFTHVTVSFKGGKTYVQENDYDSVRYVRVPCPQPFGHVDLFPSTVMDGDKHGGH